MSPSDDHSPRPDRFDPSTRRRGPAVDAPAPHGGVGLVAAGPDPADAAGALILVHGRGATAEGLVPLAAEVLDGVDGAAGFAVVAPQAAGHTWYPASFLAPREVNQPGLDSGLALLAALEDRLVAAGLVPESIALLGFSQGACLALEHAGRRPRRRRAVIAFSGGLIGPPDEDLLAGVDGSLDGTPVFLGCSDVDPHVPKERVEATARRLEALGARVDLRLYPGMGHTVVADEVEAARALLGA